LCYYYYWSRTIFFGNIYVGACACETCVVRMVPLLGIFIYINSSSHKRSKVFLCTFSLSMTFRIVWYIMYFENYKIIGVPFDPEIFKS
jgi:hypothetical protein